MAREDFRVPDGRTLDVPEIGRRLPEEVGNDAH